MKAISVRQPWAWLIAQGYRDVDNQSYPSSYRGWVLIHASASFDFEAFFDARIARRALKNQWATGPVFRRFGVEIQLPPLHTLPLGGIVGKARIVACVTEAEAVSPWFTGPYGLVLTDSQPMEFIPYLSTLRFFDVLEDVPEGEVDWVTKVYG